MVMFIMSYFKITNHKILIAGANFPIVKVVSTFYLWIQGHQIPCLKIHLFESEL